MEDIHPVIIASLIALIGVIVGLVINLLTGFTVPFLSSKLKFKSDNLISDKEFFFKKNLEIENRVFKTHTDAKNISILECENKEKRILEAISLCYSVLLKNDETSYVNTDFRKLSPYNLRKESFVFLERDELIMRDIKVLLIDIFPNQEDIKTFKKLVSLASECLHQLFFIKFNSNDGVGRYMGLMVNDPEHNCVVWRESLGRILSCMIEILSDVLHNIRRKKYSLDVDSITLKEFTLFLNGESSMYVIDLYKDNLYKIKTHGPRDRMHNDEMRWARAF